jgi:exonuclease SbcD
MTPFRFMHAADLHLDTPFRGIGQVADWLVPILRDATLTAWDRLVDATLRNECDFLVLAGDVFDHLTPTLRARFRLRDGIARLGEAGIRVFWAHGNHDFTGSLETGVTWPDNLIRFRSDGPDSVRVERDGQWLCQVAGISYPTQAVQENYARLLARDPLAPWGVAVLHANVGGQPGHDNYAPASVSDLVARGFDYWALGHIHQRTVLAEAPWIVYPGNLQGRHPRETGRKGAYLVEVGEDGTATPRFVPLNVVRWEWLAVDASGVEHWDVLRDRLDDAVAGISLDPDEEGAVVRLTVTGETTLATRSGDLDELSEELSTSPDVRPFVVVETVDSAWRAPRTYTRPGGLMAEIAAALTRWDGNPESLEGPWRKYPELPWNPEAVRARALRVLAEQLQETVPDAD